MKKNILFAFLLSISPFFSKAQEYSKPAGIKKADYAKVFPQDRVNRLDIVIAASDWKKMIADLDTNFKNMKHPGGPSFGKKGEAWQHPGPGFGNPQDSMRFAPPTDSIPFPPDFNGKDHPEFGGPGGNFPGGPPPNGALGGMPNGPGGERIFDFKPVFVACKLTFDGQTWKNVGFRFKGNSSLMMAWQRKIKKLPVMLEFGKFSDSSSYTTDRNFHGFKKLSLCNNNNDNSFLHEKLATDLFREAGVHAASSAFYRLYVDFGEGPVYLGLYTAVEGIEDCFLETQFGSRSGNCYKPEGRSANFGTDSIIHESFEKKTNKKKEDWSDVEHLNKILHSKARISHPEKWRRKLETAFDVHAFLKWLAVNTTIQNWDTYGQMAHNYYLYNNPETGQLVWIPWDNNEALSSRGRGGMSFSAKEVGDQWPLIKFLLDQDEYRQWYKEEIKNFIEKTLVPSKINERIEQYKKMIEPYISGSDGEKTGYSFILKADDFNKSIIELKKHIEKREKEARKYIAQ